MRILDELNNVLSNEEIDFSKGYLREEQRFVKHHEAIEAIAEQGHWRIVNEYPNGGKDVEWVVDISAAEPKDAYDEYETIQRFVPFTEAQLDEIKISELKQKLKDTDYIILKVVEGATTLSEVASTVAERVKWRNEINYLENKTYTTK